MFESMMIWVEMANEKYAVLVWHMNASEHYIERMRQAILEIHQQISLMNTSQKYISTIKYPIEIAISNPVKLQRFPSQREVEVIALYEAEGRHCAEMVIPYPPGIPILYEEEMIQATQLDYIMQLINSGAKFQGSSTISKGMLKVFV